jgi:formylglycine-generating enzyme required for sulfatase activity
MGTATRAGTTTVYFTGDSPASLEGCANLADWSLLRNLGDREYASGGFPFDDGYAFASPVEKFKPNPSGLYDMIGNVFEWCSVAAALRPCGCSYNEALIFVVRQRGSGMPNRTAVMPTSAFAWLWKM